MLIEWKAKATIITNYKLLPRPLRWRNIYINYSERYVMRYNYSADGMYGTNLLLW